MGSLLPFFHAPHEVRHEIGTRLRDRLSVPQGFAMTGTGSFTVVWRQHGDVRQAIAIDATAGCDDIKTELTLWLSSEKLSSIWVAALPPAIAAWKAQGDAFCGGMSHDFRHVLTDLVPSPSEDEVVRFDRFALGSRAALDDFTARLGDFAAGKLVPVLDGIGDLPALAAWALSDSRIEVLRSGNVSLPEQMASAVLARLAKPSVFEDVAQALKTNRHKAQHWRVFNDPAGRHLDRLIEHLRAMPGS